MQTEIAFDNETYIREQTSEILERVHTSGDRLYLEFGGKLLYDYHAARVLPGYDPNIKMRLLQQLKDQADILLCIYAGDIERKKMRADFGITYDSEALKLIDDLRGWGIQVLGIVITRFSGQPAARLFKNRLERRGIKVYTHPYTKGYPTNVDLIVVGGFQKRKINAFCSDSRSYGPSDKTFSDMVAVYESDFGTCQVITTRWMPQDAALFLDSSRISVLPLTGRSFHFKPLASGGDYECGELIGEYTLELRNEAAHGLIRNLSTS